MSVFVEQMRAKGQQVLEAGKHLFDFQFEAPNIRRGRITTYHLREEKNVVVFDAQSCRQRQVLTGFNPDPARTHAEEQAG